MTQEVLSLGVAAAVAIVATALIVVIFRRARRRVAATRPTQPLDAVALAHPATSSPVAERVVAVDTEGVPINIREKQLIDRIAADPRDVEAYELLGHVYLTQDNMQDAADCFRQVLALMPENLRAVEQLRRITRETQQVPATE